MKTWHRHGLAVAIAAITLAGCMVGPDYLRPDLDTPQSWRIDEKDARDLAGTAWWEQFGDPILNDLIKTALTENKDVRIAVARIDEASGRLAVVNAGLYPQVSGGAGAAHQRASHQTTNFSSTPDNVDTTFNSFQALLFATWELDIWGRIRRSTEAARADLLATDEARRAVVLSLVATVANGYISLRSLDRQLEIAQRTTQSRADSLHVFELRYKGVVVSQLVLAQSQSEYAQTQASIPQIENQIGQAENALSILLGRNPGPIPRGRPIDQLSSPTIPAGLPSDLLERRPDLKQAEQQLIAANARIGVARAAYFPSISLTGELGTESIQLSNLFSGPAAFWSLGASLVEPIFTAGAIAGQVKEAEAQQQQALISYQKAIQSAFSDVNNALIDLQKSREEIDVLNRELEALSTSARLARIRYDNGYTSYIEVLDAERQLFNAELQYADVQSRVLNANVNLYKAMGGGWVDVAEQQAPRPSKGSEG